MKNLIMFIAVTVSFSTIAQVTKEFDHSEEVACHEEIKKAGCVKTDGSEDVACVDQKLPKLSKACQVIHGEKKKQ